MDRCERVTTSGPPWAQCADPATETVEDDGDFCAVHAAEAREENGGDGGE